MPKLNDVCHHIRSKNAGPFWITVDLFFRSTDDYEAFKDAPELGGSTFERLFGANPALVKHFAVDSLNVVKISYARPRPQGWAGERDMHSGQQFTRLLDLELSQN